MEVQFVCKDCGKKPKKNEAMSNENWEVTDNKPCEDCGGTLTIKVT